MLSILLFIIGVIGIVLTYSELLFNFTDLKNNNKTSLIDYLILTKKINYNFFKIIKNPETDPIGFSKLNLSLLLIRSSQFLCLTFFCYLCFFKKRLFLLNTFFSIMVFIAITYICRDFFIGIMFVIMTLVIAILTIEKKHKVILLLLAVIFLAVLIDDPFNIRPEIIRFESGIQLRPWIYSLKQYITDRYGELDSSNLVLFSLSPLEYRNTKPLVKYPFSNGVISSYVMTYGIIPGVLMLIVFVLTSLFITIKIFIVAKSQTISSRIFIVFSIHFLFFIIISLLFELLFFETMEVPLLFGFSSVENVFHCLEFLFIIFYNPDSLSKSSD
jgi:hypothetical protein